MTPRTQFSKEDVLNAALKIIERDGLTELSARKVAREMGSSTAPVYSYYTSMDVLMGDAIEKAFSILTEYIKKPYTNINFLNMGVGFAAFARDYRDLFKALYLNESISRQHHKKQLEVFFKMMNSYDMFSVIPEDDRMQLLRRMAMFGLGNAVHICYGFLDCDSMECIIRELYEVGCVMIDDVFSRNNMDFDRAELEINHEIIGGNGNV